MGECDVFHDYVGAVAAAGVAAEGNMAAEEQSIEVLEGM